MKTKSLLSVLVLPYIIPIASRTIPATSSGPPVLDDQHAGENVTAEKLQSDYCDCYGVAGPDQGYFQHYQFWDFRSFPLHLYSPTPGQKERDTTSTSINIRDEHGDKDEDENEDNKDFDSDFDDSTTTTDEDGQGAPTILLSHTPFATDWTVQHWHRTTPVPDDYYHVPMANSKRNVFITMDRKSLQDDDGNGNGNGNDNDNDNPISFYSTYLALQVKRFDNYTLSAEIESNIRNVYHCSVRVRMRILSSDEVVSPDSIPVNVPVPVPVPAPDPSTITTSTTSSGDGTSPEELELNPDPPLPPSGACAGIFTYHPNDTIESDIEILTSDPPYKIHYANQPDYDPVTDDMIPGASSVVDLPVPWTSWTTHRLDWFPGVTRWYSDGKLRDTKTYRVPDKPSAVVINLWSDGGDWTGDLRPGESVVMGVEWIEMVYNVSNEGSQEGEVTASGSTAYQDGSHYGYNYALDQERCTRVCLVDERRRY